MLGTVSRVSGAPSVSTPSLSRLTTAWLSARLPAVSSTMTRSPGTSKTCILPKVETWSMPALVRVSDSRTMPSLRSNPTQYVIPSASSPAPPLPPRPLLLGAGLQDAHLDGKPFAGLAPPQAADRRRRPVIEADGGADIGLARADAVR